MFITKDIVFTRYSIDIFTEITGWGSNLSKRKKKKNYLI